MRLSNGVAKTVAVNILVALVSGGIGLFVAKGLGAADRGIYAVAMAWFSIAYSLGELPATPGIVYYVAKYPQKRLAVLRSARFMFLAIGLVVGSVLILLAVLTSSIPSTSFWALVILGLASPLIFQAAVPLSSLLAMSTSKWNLARTAQTVSFALALAVFWATSHFTVITVVAALSGSYAASIFASYALLSRQPTPPPVSVQQKTPDKPNFTRSLWLYGLKTFPSTVPSAFSGKLDVVLMSQHVAAAEIGNYAVAVTIAGLALPAATAIPLLALPRLARMPEAASASEKRGLAKRAVLAAGAIAAPFALVPALTAWWLIPILLGPSYSGTGLLVCILAAGVPASAMSLTSRNVMRGLNSPQSAIVPEWCSLVVLILLLLVLVPTLGSPGAATAVTIGAWFLVCAYQLMTRRLLSTKV